MEFDFTTILYVVFGIIYFVFTNMNKNKKKARQQSAEPRDFDGPETVGPPPIKRNPTFEELLEEFTGNKPKEEPKPIPVPVPKLKEVIQSKSYPDRLPKVIEVEPKSNEHELDSFTVAEEYEVVEEEREDYAAMFSDLDGAKRAFIASEIFQRKY
ncbi:hypothetical protein [Roseivirga sp.]|uniref:hypothetical protein n=1 Tax=Roseivirga sp. TaxID=1964215 RepID=UPI003B8DEEC5